MTDESISRRGLFRLLKEPPTQTDAKLLSGRAIREELRIYHLAGGLFCERWAEHMRRAGFVTRITEVEDQKPLRERLRVPADLAACHSAEISRYTIEGHVPAIAVRRLLDERPDATGLAVPGMPSGSPGVERPDEDQYDVILFGPTTRKVYMKFAGARWIE